MLLDHLDQASSGYKKINSSLIYARAYDQTVADDYFAAMGVVEQQRLALPEDRLNQSLGLAEMVSLVDSLPQAGTLTSAQAEAVWSLRTGLRLLLANQDSSIVKVQEDSKP